MIGASWSVRSMVGSLPTALAMSAFSPGAGMGSPLAPRLCT